MIDCWFGVEAVDVRSTPSLKRATWEEHPAAAPATISMAHPRARLRPFSLNTLKRIALTRIPGTD
jgi:hypothetical protein